jgi:hypothetical protein
MSQNQKEIFKKIGEESKQDEASIKNLAASPV